ncbi:hypothetical protein [Sphingobacterium sp. 2149]|uniref:hypothetical protein n=1 Tax=Sphingobacterium sp. 2149 TaxID=2817763 RepID=UPI00285B341C|nr:hypothetical protein [Sphingobacterium sp. 2149]MDR6734189.1 hypothetical protein [Sphingobacterium sp. 2149]
MERSYIEKIKIVLDSFIDKTNDLGIYQTPISLSRRIAGKSQGIPISSILLDMKNYGLLESDSHVVLTERQFFLTAKGRQVVLFDGIENFFKDIEAKEQLELKILQQTNQSFKLNTIQFIITAILAVGTIGSLFIQWRTFEMEKDKTELEIRDLKSRLDSIQKPILKNNKD